MTTPTHQKVWVLNQHPTAGFEADTFKLETRPLPELQEGQLLVQIQYLSNDPAQRGWMTKMKDPKRAYVPPIQLGEPIRAGAIGTVIQSKSKNYAVGDRVNGQFGWYDYAVVDEAKITNKAIELPNKPYASLSVLGMTSVTAYQGIFETLALKPEHTLVVSGAAGAVGSTAIQIAKHVVGAKRVVGIAGGKEKCDWVKSLGADDCVDYKDPNFAQNLADALQGGYADRYFENVGGEVLNAMLPLVARHGKIAVCGMISSYMGKAPTLPNLGEVIMNRIVIEGFIVVDMIPKWAKAVTDLAGWIQAGKIQAGDVETVVPAKIEDVPEKYLLLFSGSNRGKLITSLVAENSAL